MFETLLEIIIKKTNFQINSQICSNYKVLDQWVILQAAISFYLTYGAATSVKMERFNSPYMVFYLTR